MEKPIEIKPNKVTKTKIRRDIDINIVNGLGIDLNCQIELVGQQLTIWINKK